MSATLKKIPDLYRRYAKKPSFSYGIQILRAIAVLLVYFFHISKQGSGFLGVSIFFVISGYVIAYSCALNDQGPDKPSLFWKRRIARLFPGLFTSTVIISLTLSFFNAIDNHQLKTAASALLGWSNILLALTGSDYFGTGGESNVFTATWSLGVEEQAYLFITIIYFAHNPRLGQWLSIRRNQHLTVEIRNSSINRTLVIVTICSFVADVLMQQLLGPIKSYYLPFGRVWEILIGWLIYNLNSSRVSKLAGSNEEIEYVSHPWELLDIGPIKAIACLVILVITTLFQPHWISKYVVIVSTCIFLISNEKSFGFSRPKRAQVLDILYNMFSRISDLLINHLLWIATISYSFYLYHSAVLLLLPSSGVQGKMINYSGIIILASVSHFYVESPFQKFLLRSDIYRKTLMLWLSAILIITLLYVYDKRYNVVNRQIYLWPDESVLFKPPSQLLLESSNLINPKNPTIYILGDSHAAAATNFFSALAKNSISKYNVQGIRLTGIYTTSMVKPTSLNNSHGELSKNSSDAYMFLDSVLKRGDVVFLANQQTTWLSSTYNDKLSDHRLALASSSKQVVSQHKALSVYLLDLDKLAKLLTSKSSALVIQLTPPDFKLHPSRCRSLTANLFGNLLPNDCQQDKNAYLDKIELIEQGVSRLSNNKDLMVDVYKPYKMLCDNDHCSSIDEKGKSLYFDDDHLGYNFYKKFGETVLDSINIANAKASSGFSYRSK